MHTSKDDYLIKSLRFVSAKESTQIYGAILPECLTSLVMKESKAYKTYLGYATGVVPPKMAQKFKKASCSSRLLPNDDKRNLAQIADAPTGSEDAIVVPEITADKFELKHGLLTLKTNNFSDMTKKTLYLTFRYFTDHVCYEFPERPSTTVKLSISHFSLDGAARDMLKKTLSCDRFLHGMILFRNSSTNSSLLPKQQIFEMKSQDFNNDLMKLFTRHGPIKTSFGHAPHHGFSNYINLYFYNALNSNDQDIVNSTAGYPAIAIPHQKNVPAQIYRQTRALDSLTESELSTRGSRTFLALKDEPTSPKLEDTYNDPDVDIR
ncbi:hypothetical protein Tco_1437999 [Tanacetum coccineum]